MKVREHDIDVDVLEEIDPYLDSFNMYRIRGEELQACSPFRDESTPSFNINLNTGLWIDFGATDTYSSGNLLTLLAFLMETSYESVEALLLDKYLGILAEVDGFELSVVLEEEETYRTYTQEELKPFLSYRSPYLDNRGITDKVQRAFKTGYDKKRKAVAIPWKDRNGDVINVKFRNVLRKSYFYMEDGQQLKNHLYGLHFIYKHGFKRVYLVESEVDAMTLWGHKIPAVAIGTASLSKRQEELLRMSPVEEVVLALDNDYAGYHGKLNTAKRLGGLLTLEEVELPKGIKDINELHEKRPEKFEEIVNGTKPYAITFLQIS